MSKITIRKVKSGDEKILAYIQTEAWKAAFVGIISDDEMQKYTNLNAAEELYKNVLGNNYGNGYILDIDGKPHCMAFWSKSRDEKYSDTAELICIHSLPDNWCKGYGSMMMEHIISEIKSAGYGAVVLWVFEENVYARKFYEKHGFESTDNRNNSYSAAEIMYKKELKR